MPGKGRKVAARQAQVGRRRRRQTREGVAVSSGTISAERLIGNDEGEISVLDLVTENNATAIVTASGIDSMPSEISDRISNVSQMIKQCLEREIPLSRIYLDALVFPIAVDQNFGNHYLEAVAQIRERFGEKIHITGGLSNVSFGLPLRKLINDTFIRLSIESGVDSAILNPVESDVERIFALDMESERVQTTINMLLGKDEYCTNFLSKYRSGKLTEI